MNSFMGTIGDNFLLRFINTLFKQFGQDSIVWGELVVPSEFPSKSIIDSFRASFFSCSVLMGIRVQSKTMINISKEIIKSNPQKNYRPPLYATLSSRKMDSLNALFPCSDLVNKHGWKRAWHKNIKWKVPEVNHSLVLNCAPF
ncbi:hypothetical protein HJG60_010361 [Phyllostomus discolor]|uniref:Uncharacterized protein n=1 Tax=Phyllostomus discolor TaxID=89673 RepID=A0A834AT10_9CHIR|nr:hypothetical protein HJG60_010361 [Phyllostomus discolor]